MKSVQDKDKDKDKDTDADNDYKDEIHKYNALKQKLTQTEHISRRHEGPLIGLADTTQELWSHVKPESMNKPHLISSHR